MQEGLRNVVWSLNILKQYIVVQQCTIYEQMKECVNVSGFVSVLAITTAQQIQVQ